ncbi:MAG: hypothetical protein M3070_05620 [Actinomycetota bacterium]|nr:hypothetical protein [Actinomycetota bacterium]
MIIIGVVLLLAAAVFGLDLLWKNTFKLNNPVVVFGQSLGIDHAGWLFLAGAITGAAIMLGIGLILAGMRRKGHRAVENRRDRKRARKTEEAREKLESDNASLRDDLERERNSPPAAGGRGLGSGSDS